MKEQVYTAIGAKGVGHVLRRDETTFGEVGFGVWLGIIVSLYKNGVTARDT
jgi:hypothetical protein